IFICYIQEDTSTEEFDEIRSDDNISMISMNDTTTVTVICLVYAGALSALALMTALATFIGFLTSFIARWIVIYSSASIMLLFGLKMVFDAYRMTPQRGQEEFEEVEMQKIYLFGDFPDIAPGHSIPATILIGPEGALTLFTKMMTSLIVLRNAARQVDLRERGGGTGSRVGDAMIEENNATASTEQIEDEPARNTMMNIRSFAKTFVESFVLTFLAEWGDRSQVSTVLLTAT
ncbi:hypothetical protein PRIPAC_96125, partial [Pristionchus pacificus]|uniref:GDT1 family protein n=1 Tax=Pristionchus pacificus TaxID=54126 RepID=A0A2A6CU49_PRIPA